LEFIMKSKIVAALLVAASATLAAPAFASGYGESVQTVAAERAAADGNTAYGGVNDQTSESGHLHFAKIASLFHRN
jgi:predicted small secreted protein